MVEQAKLLLQAKEEAVTTVENDLQYLKSVHTDLAKKYTALTEEAEEQDRQSKQTELQQNHLQCTQQAIWQAATTIRGLGADPRIEAALAALESLFKSVQGESAQLPPQPAPQPPPMVQPPISLGVPASAPTNAPVAAPAMPSICNRCWSVACRCRPLPATAVAVGGVMEVDQERGTKRSCKEAELSERANQGPATPGALLVDSAGNGCINQEETPAAQVQHPTQQAVPEMGEGADGPEADGVPKDHAQPVAMVVEKTQASESPSSGKPSAVEPATEEGSKSADTGALPEKYAKADNIDEEAAKEESKRTFSNLVKAACSNRSYPY